MTPRSERHHDRIMTAALSRRRALRGLAGGVALGLVTDLRRARARTIPPDAAPLYDLAAATIRPDDLPDGEGYAVASGIKFFGASGLLESRIVDVDSRMVLGLEPHLGNLVGGYQCTVVPIAEGTPIAWVTTTSFQFTNTDVTREAMDAIANTHFGEATEHQGGSDRARYFSWLFTEDGGTSIPVASVLAQARNITYTIDVAGLDDPAAFATTPTPTPVPLTPTPTPDLGKTRVSALDDLTAALESYRRTVAGRMGDVVDQDYTSIVTTTPTVGEFGMAIRDFNFGISQWNDVYLITDGHGVRQSFQTAEAYQRFLDEHAHVQDAYSRTEIARTFNGTPLVAMQEGYRFRNNDEASAYFERLAPRLLRESEEKETVDLQPIDIQGSSPDVPAQYYLETYVLQNGTINGMGGWHLKDNDVRRFFLGADSQTVSMEDQQAFEAFVDFMLMASYVIAVLTGRREEFLASLSTEAFARLEEICSQV